MFAGRPRWQRVPERFQRRGVLLEARQRRGPFPTQNVALGGELRVVASYPFGGRDDRFGSPDEMVPGMPQALQQAETVARDAMHGLVPRTGEVLECDQPVLVAGRCPQGRLRVSTSGTRTTARAACPGSPMASSRSAVGARRNRAMTTSGSLANAWSSPRSTSRSAAAVASSRTVPASGILEQRAECIGRRHPRQGRRGVRTGHRLRSRLSGRWPLRRHRERARPPADARGPRPSAWACV